MVEIKSTDYEPKDVYVGMVADLLHEGHINILLYASEVATESLGLVVVGLLTDDCVEGYKRRPIQSWENRKTVVSAIRYVDMVVPQPTLSYKDNLLKYRPKFVVHGDDWKTGPQSKARQEVIDTLKEWDGILRQPSYTPNVSTTDLIGRIKCT